MSSNLVASQRVAQVKSNLNYEIEHPLINETDDVHISSIKLYSDSLVSTIPQTEEIAYFSARIW